VRLIRKTINTGQNSTAHNKFVRDKIILERDNILYSLIKMGIFFRIFYSCNNYKSRGLVRENFFLSFRACFVQSRGLVTQSNI
jgi:hypothetical protein